MPETVQPTPGDGRPPAQTPTGEIVNQGATTPPTLTPPTSTPTTTPETKPDDNVALLNRKDEAPAGAPEAYAEFKVPEGFTLDAEVAKEASTIFKGMNLNQTQAQSLVDFYVAKTQEAAQQPYKVYEDTRKGWQAEVMANPEIGGKLNQVKATIGSALDGIGDSKLTETFKEVMNFTGAGDHPAFIQVFYKLAQMVTEGKPVSAGGPVGVRQPGTGQRSIAQAMYPNLPS